MCFKQFWPVCKYIQHIYECLHPPWVTRTPNSESLAWCCGTEPVRPLWCSTETFWGLRKRFHSYTAEIHFLKRHVGKSSPNSVLNIGGPVSRMAFLLIRPWKFQAEPKEPAILLTRFSPTYLLLSPSSSSSSTFLTSQHFSWFSKLYGSQWPKTYFLFLRCVRKIVRSDY